jgi:hypothetical protein
VLRELPSGHDHAWSAYPPKYQWYTIDPKALTQQLYPFAWELGTASREKGKAFEDRAEPAVSSGVFAGSSTATGAS